MEERLERASQSCGRSRKAKNGEKKIPQRGLGVAQLEKLRMEEQQKQQQQQRVMGLIPQDQLHRQIKASFQPPHPSPTAPFALDLPPRDSIICLAGLNVSVPVHMTNNNYALAESNSCVTHVSVAPDSVVSAPFQQGLGSEISGSAAVNHRELMFFEPSLWPSGPPTELPMMNVSSCGAVQTEPPSNQIYSDNAGTWPEENKIPGRKRFWPFSEANMLEVKSSRVEPSSQNTVGVFSEQGHRQQLSPLGQGIVKDSCSSNSTNLMQPSFQLNWKGSYENDISSQEKEVPSDFLTLGLSTSVNDFLDSNFKKHSGTSDGKDSSTSDACEEPGHPNHLQQELSTEAGSRAMCRFGGLLKHRSTSAIDDRCGIPFYKFLCYESNTKGIAESMCQDNIKKPADLDLRLTL
ncbi:uncharacterized protein LOC131027471 isoform X2 [Cryptomeria japonica]|uniref:uncharacterized protein LOC131027471 isoform X2 n=1 Tax=Cryptomeria japonica TaxID=3369 RepID=UPI0025ABAF75|nr:uncharacterized protein LOC131027471 isoform X2 [Cryptomeria japonica]